MKIVIGTLLYIMGHSNDLPIEHYAKLIHKARKFYRGNDLWPLTQAERQEIDEEIREEAQRPGKMDIKEAEIIAAAERWESNGMRPGDHEMIMRGCISHWLSDPKIHAGFASMAPTHDGAVRITCFGLETDWYVRQEYSDTFLDQLRYGPV